MNDELTLIKKILAGDEAAWHRFVVMYTPLIQKTLGQYINDRELATDLYVSLLEKLKENKLASFIGRSSVSTWLYIVTRNHCRDYFRSQKGIRHVMTALKELGKTDRRLFELHYLQGLSIVEAFKSMYLEMKGKISYIDLMDSMDRIQKIVARKQLGRILDRLVYTERRTVPYIGRMGDVQSPLERRNEPVSPLQTMHIDGDDLETAFRNLREALLKLPHRDRLLLKLKFEHKESSRRIQEILDLANERQVGRKIDSLLCRLREMLMESGLRREVYEEVARNIEDLCMWRGTWDGLDQTR